MVEPRFVSPVTSSRTMVVVASVLVPVKRAGPARYRAVPDAFEKTRLFKVLFCAVKLLVVRLVLVAFPTNKLPTSASVAARFVVVAAEKMLLEAKKFVAIRLFIVPVDATRTLDVVTPNTFRFEKIGLEEALRALVRDSQPDNPYPSKSVPFQRMVPNRV